jgi:hypothetical protein
MLYYTFSPLVKVDHSMLQHDLFKYDEQLEWVVRRPSEALSQHHRQAISQAQPTSPRSSST